MKNTQIRFRDSWFIKVGVGIILLSASPLAAVILVGC
jgi:hypothetical protein